jgi:methanethiol S-methyltransferase
MTNLPVLLVLSWLIYFLIHSALASISIKDLFASRFPDAMPYYRLTYNLLAMLLLLVPLGVTYSWTGDWLWRWSGVLNGISIGISLLAVLGFLWSLKFYDTREFLGFRQLSEHITSVEDQEHFHISPLHRWVRHPWYFFALLLIWTRDMNGAILISSIMMTLYFIVGSRYEERKLIRYHGERYRLYSELVPGLIPLPWKYLSERQLDELLDAEDQ